MKQKSKVWERNTILKERNIKLRGRKSNACKRNIILREWESIAWERNVLRGNEIRLCIAMSPPGLRILVCTYMPNIRILAKLVLQIFCSQGCSNTKCLCLKKGSNSTKNLRSRFKSQSVHLHLGLKLYAKYQDPSQSGSSVILFTRLFLYKMPVSEKGE